MPGRNKAESKKRGYIYLFFLLIAIGGLPFFIHDWNYDGICYMNLSRRYASGEFSGAINGYWSPMYSWLMAIPIKIGFSPVLAAKLLNIAIGLFALRFWLRILESWDVTGWKFTAAGITMAINIAWYGWVFITPDLLFFTVSLFLLLKLSKGTFLDNPVRAGMIGAFMYLTKAFGFYFFLAFLTLFAIRAIIKSTKHKLQKLNNYFISMGVFLAISFCWIALIHMKYGTWVISTSAGYNHSILKTGSLFNDFLEAGPLPPPDRNSTSAWDDIYLTYEIRDWGMFETKENFELQLSIWGSNIIHCTRLLVTHNPGGFVCLIMGLLLMFSGRIVDTSQKQKVVTFIIFSLIWLGGYELRFFEARYIWVIFAIGTLFGLYMLDENSPITSINDKTKNILVAILLFSSCARTLYDLRLVGKGKDAWRFAIEAEKLHFPASTKIASWKTSDTWIMSWKNNWLDFGGISSSEDQGVVYERLKKFKVDYVIVPDTLKNLPFYLNDSTRVKENLKLVEVYRVK